MVIRLTLALFLWMAAAAAPAADRCSEGSEFEPPLCPFDLPEIATLTISENAAKSPAESDPAISCAGFRLTPRQVRRFLASAKATHAEDAHHTLDWSPCYAAGRVQFRDGRSGAWYIDQYRGGRLKIGEEPETVLYCPRCRFKPFQW